MKTTSRILLLLSTVLLASCGNVSVSSSSQGSSSSSSSESKESTTSVAESSSGAESTSVIESSSSAEPSSSPVSDPSSTTSISSSQVAPGGSVSLTSSLLPATAQSKYLPSTEVTIGETKFMVNRVQQGTGSYAGHIQVARGKDDPSDTTVTLDPGSIYNETQMSGILTLFILDKTSEHDLVKATLTVYTGSSMNPSEEEATATSEAVTIDGKKYDVYTYTILKGYFALWDNSARVAYIKELRVTC